MSLSLLWWGFFLPLLVISTFAVFCKLLHKAEAAALAAAEAAAEAAAQRTRLGPQPRYSDPEWQRKYAEAERRHRDRFRPMGRR